MFTFFLQTYDYSKLNNFVHKKFQNILNRRKKNMDFTIVRAKQRHSHFSIICFALKGYIGYIIFFLLANMPIITLIIFY